MNGLLSLIKILLLIIGLPTLPLGFMVGIPFMLISFPCLFGAFAIDRYQAKLKNGGVAHSSSHTVWNFVIIIFGIGIYFAITNFFALGNIDTSGQADSNTKIVALIVSVAVIAAGLFMVNRKKV